MLFNSKKKEKPSKKKEKQQEDNVFQDLGSVIDRRVYQKNIEEKKKKTELENKAREQERIEQERIAQLEKERQAREQARLEQERRVKNEQEQRDRDRQEQLRLQQQQAQQIATPAPARPVMPKPVTNIPQVNTYQSTPIKPPTAAFNHTPVPQAQMNSSNLQSLSVSELTALLQQEKAKRELLETKLREEAIQREIAEKQFEEEQQKTLILSEINKELHLQTQLTEVTIHKPSLVVNHNSNHTQSLATIETENPLNESYYFKDTEVKSDNQLDFSKPVNLDNFEETVENDGSELDFGNPINFDSFEDVDKNNGNQLDFAQPVNFDNFEETEEENTNSNVSDFNQNDFSFETEKFNNGNSSEESTLNTNFGDFNFPTSFGSVNEESEKTHSLDFETNNDTQEQFANNFNMDNHFEFDNKPSIDNHFNNQSQPDFAFESTNVGLDLPQSDNSPSFDFGNESTEFDFDKLNTPHETPSDLAFEFASHDNNIQENSEANFSSDFNMQNNNFDIVEEETNHTQVDNQFDFNNFANQNSDLPKHEAFDFSNMPFGDNNTNFDVEESTSDNFSFNEETNHSLPNFNSFESQQNYSFNSSNVELEQMNKPVLFEEETTVDLVENLDNNFSIKTDMGYDNSFNGYENNNPVFSEPSVAIFETPKPVATQNDDNLGFFNLSEVNALPPMVNTIQEKEEENFGFFETTVPVGVPKSGVQNFLVDSRTNLKDLDERFKYPHSKFKEIKDTLEKFNVTVKDSHNIIEEFESRYRVQSSDMNKFKKNIDADDFNLWKLLLGYEDQLNKRELNLSFKHIFKPALLYASNVGNEVYLPVNLNKTVDVNSTEANVEGTFTIKNEKEKVVLTTTAEFIFNHDLDMELSNNKGYVLEKSHSNEQLLQEILYYFKTDYFQFYLKDDMWFRYCNNEFSFQLTGANSLTATYSFSMDKDISFKTLLKELDSFVKIFKKFKSAKSFSFDSHLQLDKYHQALSKDKQRAEVIRTELTQYIDSFGLSQYIDSDYEVIIQKSPIYSILMLHQEIVDNYKAKMHNLFPLRKNGADYVDLKSVFAETNNFIASRHEYRDFYLLSEVTDLYKDVVEFTK